MADTPSLSSLVELTTLVGLIDAAAGTEADPVARVGLAVLLADQLGELGDHLIGHFVDAARAAGASWQAIGAGLGVSKQAAQKRFVPDAGDLTKPGTGMLSRFAPRAKTAVIETTQTEARRLHHTEVGTDDLLLAIVKDPDGFAAKAVVAQGVTLRQLRQAVRPATAPAPHGPPPERIPYSSRAKKSLELAVRHALRLGHNYVGTEHLLLAILDDRDGAGAQALAAVGIDPPAITAWLERALAAAAAQRR